MFILNRYIGKNIFFGILIVLSILLSLFTFFQILDELGDVGKGRYDAGKAILYVLMTLPTTAYQLLPITALIGCTVGLGVLANNSELTAIRAAGVSIEQIIWSVLKVGLLIIVAGFVIGEWVAPITEQKAQTMRSVAQSSHLSLKGSQGLWAKDGTQYINVRAVLPGRRLNDIYIYEVDHQHHVTHIMYAASAYYRDENWILEDVKHSYIVKGNVVADHKEEHVWNTTLRPELLSVVTVKPNTLSIWGLYQYVQYLEANGLSAEKYKQSLWTKATLPVVTVLMVLLSIPFVFGPMRSVSIGTRVLVGTLVGIGFHLVSQMFAYMGLVFELNTAFSALLPTLLAMLIVVLMLRRVH